MSEGGPVGVGAIGAGMISDTYLENLTSFPDVRVLVIGDLDRDRARAQAKYAVPGSGTAEDVLSHPDVELVVNLTIPAVHAQVSMDAVAAGKHVWSEKPISIDRESGQTLLRAAQVAGVQVGVAPDTVLGPGMQTARRAIARGDIGVPLSAQTVMQYPGPDLFHPNPEFLFSRGAGPLFDMGPYYLTALVHILGPVRKVAAFGSQGRAERTVQVGARTGASFAVEVPTHVSAIAQFAEGGVSQSVFSFDSALPKVGVIEISGTEGTLIVPDPNHFTGAVKVTHAPTHAAMLKKPRWRTVPVTGALAGRGTGVLDLARRTRSGGSPLASGALGYHVLDILMAIDESMTTGRTVDVSSTVDPVPLVPDDWDPYAATLEPVSEADPGKGVGVNTGTDRVNELAEQEDRLVLDRFEPTDAWSLGTLMVERALRERLPVIVDIRRPSVVLFRAALDGTTAENEAWLDRKARTVFRFEASTALVAARFEADGVDVWTSPWFDTDRFTAAGGSIPVRVRGAGVVAAVTVSGLTSDEDHDFAVEALEALRGKASAA